MYTTVQQMLNRSEIFALVVIALGMAVLATAKSPQVKLSYPHTVRRELPAPDPVTVNTVGAQLALDFQLLSPKNDTNNNAVVETPQQVEVTPQQVGVTQPQPNEGDIPALTPEPITVPQQTTWVSDTAVVANQNNDDVAPDSPINETEWEPVLPLVEEVEDEEHVAPQAPSSENKVNTPSHAAPLLRASDMQCTVIYGGSSSLIPTRAPAWTLSCYDIPKATLDTVTFVEAQDCTTVAGVRECTVALPLV